MTPEQADELKRKFSQNIPFTKAEKKLLLDWKIKQLLKEAGGEMSVGELYEKLGVVQ